MKLPAPLIYAMMILVIFLSAVIVYDDSVMTQQRGVIRQMMHNPACMVEQPPIKLETF